MSVSIIRHKNLVGRIPLVSSLARGLWRIYRALRISQYYNHSQNLTLMSDAEKRDHLASWQRLSGYKVFVETGTYLGKTTLAMSVLFDKVHTIEVDQALFDAAKTMLAPQTGVTCHLGSSSDVLPRILAELDRPAVFWLDAHYSGGPTGFKSVATPVEQELQLIFAHPIKDHIILIDDARDFIGIDSYPTIRKLHAFVSRNSKYQMRIHNDCIRIYPLSFN